jgi:uncharacterized membrane protein
MGNLWLKIKVWTKVILFGLLLIYLIFFVMKNSEQKVRPWFWFTLPQSETSVLKLVLVAFVSGVLGTILVRTTFNTVRQIREIQRRNRSEKLERGLEEMKMKAAMLRSRPAAEGDAAADLDAVPPA